ncbi:MAG: hypothetical protein Q8N73_01775 [bacterium]|nr:hypothetical protein [bacterium]
MHKIIVVNPRGVAVVLDLQDYLAFVKIRVVDGGISIHCNGTPIHYTQGQISRLKRIEEELKNEV